MSNSIGTKQWAAKGGSLRHKDQARLMAQAMLTQLARMPDRLRHRLGFEPAQATRIDLSTIRLPDSPAARQALELSRQLTAPWILNHSLRTYLWGAMLAQTERIRFDEELFYVASTLHDLGLADAHKCRDTGCACFAVEGARAAEHFATDLGWSSERRDRLFTAISLHLNIRVGLEQGPEAHLLHEGAALDVIGARLRELHPDTVQEVLRDYPRLDFKAGMSAAMKEQAKLRPQSRAALLVRLGFIGMIRAAPYSE
jgi:hypothetical protein